VDLYKKLAASYPKRLKKLSVGIICPYAAMRDELRLLINKEFTANVAATISIVTIDGFQVRT
jgi:superfamily I DNA and/or RNA helicase